MALFDLKPLPNWLIATLILDVEENPRDYPNWECRDCGQRVKLHTKDLKCLFSPGYFRVWEPDARTKERRLHDVPFSTRNILQSMLIGRRRNLKCR